MITPDLFSMSEPFSGINIAPGVPAGFACIPAGNTRRDVPPAAAAVNTMLESKGIKVTLSPNQENGDKFFRGIAVHCKSWMCSSCRIPKGKNLRKQLLKKVSLFKAPRLFTLTVNRDYFESPEVAYEYVMKNKFIARLLTKEMGVVSWFWVLEVQEKNGDGWPHWHILIDVGNLPGMWYHKESQAAQIDKPAISSGWCYVPRFFDLNRVHHLLKKWHIGEQCELSKRRFKFQNPEHAIRYITKYMIKPPERGFPEWMLKHKGLRFYQPSRAVGSIAEEKQTAPKQAKEPKESMNKQSQTRLPIDRIAECAKQVLFMSYNPNKDKNTTTKPIKALKESIPLAPGAVCVQYFDPVTLRTFPVWGFKTIEDVGKFEEFWEDSRMQAELSRRTEEKYNELLSRWNAPL